MSEGQGHTGLDSPGEPVDILVLGDDDRTLSYFADQLTAAYINGIVESSFATAAKAVLPNVTFVSLAVEYQADKASTIVSVGNLVEEGLLSIQCLSLDESAAAICMRTGAPWVCDRCADFEDLNEAFMVCRCAVALCLPVLEQLTGNIEGSGHTQATGALLVGFAPHHHISERDIALLAVIASKLFWKVEVITERFLPDLLGGTESARSLPRIKEACPSFAPLTTHKPSDPDADNLSVISCANVSPASGTDEEHEYYPRPASSPCCDASPSTLPVLPEAPTEDTVVSSSVESAVEASTLLESCCSCHTLEHQAASLGVVFLGCGCGSTCTCDLSCLLCSVSCCNAAWNNSKRQAVSPADASSLEDCNFDRSFAEHEKVASTPLDDVDHGSVGSADNITLSSDKTIGRKDCCGYQACCPKQDAKQQGIPLSNNPLASCCSEADSSALRCEQDYYNSSYPKTKDSTATHSGPSFPGLRDFSEHEESLYLAWVANLQRCVDKAWFTLGLVSVLTMLASVDSDLFTNQVFALLGLWSAMPLLSMFISPDWYCRHREFILIKHMMIHQFLRSMTISSLARTWTADDNGFLSHACCIIGTGYLIGSLSLQMRTWRLAIYLLFSTLEFTLPRQLIPIAWPQVNFWKLLGMVYAGRALLAVSILILHRRMERQYRKLFIEIVHHSHVD